MTLLVFLFVGLLIIVAFYLNSLLDKREEKKAGQSRSNRRDPL